MRSVIFDLDGTLANVNHRRHHVSGKIKDWNAFNRDMMLDTLDKDVFEMYLYHKSKGDKIIICTGRFQRYVAITDKWMADHRIYPDAVFMRPDGNFDSDYLVKEQFLVYLHDCDIKPYLAYDDRDCVVAMWRRNGLKCFQVAEEAF